jgi:PE-PPE domain
MRKTFAGAAFALPLLVTGSIYLIVDSLSSTSGHAVHHDGVVLTSGDSNDALVLIPAENAEYANVANALYLAPNGFDGTATVFLTPSAGNEVQNVVPGVQALVQTIEADYAAGDLSATSPLYVFGYSEGAVEEGLAEQQLAAYDGPGVPPGEVGIPQADLHFVMVGDSASAEGGFLNTFIESLPESEQQSTTEFLALLGLSPPVLGATTPDDLYPTDVYSLSADGWTNWDDGANTYGMFTDHLEYLGLTPAEIATAAITHDGMTTYHTIDNANVNDLAALSNQFLLALGIAPSNVDTTDAVAATAAMPDTLGELWSQSIADLGTLSAEWQVLAADLGTALFGAFG